MAKSNTVKGFKDFIGEEALKRKAIKDIIEREFELFGFEPAETPIIENRDFVKGDNEDDEAVRDIFKLEDRGKRKLGLRFEFTFQLKRLAKNQKLPYKRYQIGYNFRDEPVREGRLRQFIQCDADVIGSSVKDEAECLSIWKNIFEKLNIPVTIYINNRRLINEILISEKIEEKYREQVIRELDKLDKLSKKEVADNLKKYNAEKLVKIFTQEEQAFKDYKFYKEIKELKDYCKEYNLNVEFRPFLARGLAYYNGSVFEVWSKDLNVSLCGGGAYLVDRTQAVGISFGLEPIMLLTNLEGQGAQVQITSNDQDKEAIRLANTLREENISVNMILDKTFSKALEYANSKKTPYTIIIGEKEVKSKQYTLKDMNSGKEEQLSTKDLIKKIKKSR